ncbi:flippase [Halomarina oriensis]|nr:flippase [Halomarina oriensis]
MDRSLQVSSLGSIFRGAGFFAAGKVLYNVLRFLFNFVLTRGLGVELYGIYAFANTVVGAAITVTTLGSDKAVLRYLPALETDVERRGILVFALALSLFGSFTAATLLWVFAPLLTQYTLEDPALVPTIRILAGLLVARALLKVLSSAFRALDLPEYDVLVQQIARPLVGLLAVAVAFQFGYQLVGAVTAIAISSLLVLVIGLAFLGKKTDIHVFGRVPRGDIVEYTRFSLPLTVKDAGSFLYTRADVLMVGYFLTSSAVGIYNVSVLLATVVVLPLSALNRIFPSVASRLHEAGQRTELESIYATVTRWGLTASLPIAVFGIVLGSEVLAVFGSGFSTGELVLAFFLLGQLLNAAVGPSGYLLLMTDHQYLVSLNQTTFGVLNLILNYFFIVEFGMVGAAAATAAILGTLNVVRLVEVWHYERMVPYSRRFVKPLVAIAVAGGVVIGCRQFLDGLALVVGGGALGGVVYLGLLVTMGVEPDDVDFAREYLG